jgi:hypothetical protein
LSDFLRDSEDDRQPRLDRVDHPGIHVGGGMPVAGADPTAAVQLAMAAALVAHEFIDHPGGDAGVLQPGVMPLTCPPTAAGSGPEPALLA